jgi:hypothetical protein
VHALAVSKRNPVEPVMPSMRFRILIAKIASARPPTTLLPILAEQQISSAGNERSRDHSERGGTHVSRMQSPRLTDGGLRQRQKIENGGGRYDREQVEGAV